jgi:hypothetical protein
MEREFLGVWIPKEVYLHKGLNPTEKLLLAEISSFAKNGTCFASNEHFSEFLGISKGHVSKLVTKLVRMDLIKVDLVYKKGTKEVEKRTITPILTQEHTPTLLGVDPLLTQEHTPTHSCVDPIVIDAYYKEHNKIQYKEQEKEQNKNKDKNTKMSISSKKLEEEFEQLWKIYPRKVGRKIAFDSFKKARKIKKVPYETIENGLYRYIKYLEQQETDEQYIMHASTWFNQEKWQDDYITSGINRKPKNATEYLRAKYGGDFFEPSRNGEIIEYHPESIPELF